MNPGQVIVHIITPEALSPDLALACLSEIELVRFKRFRFPEDARRWASFRAQMRRILGGLIGEKPEDVPIVLSEQGKPLLAPPHHTLHFNLSHCSDRGILALSGDGPLGVDIEPLNRGTDLPESESIFCHPAELGELPENAGLRASRLLEIWTAKEAVLKALGTGLIQAPEAVRVDLSGLVGLATSDSPIPGLCDQRLHVLEDSRLAEYRAVLSAPSSVHSISFV